MHKWSAREQNSNSLSCIVLGQLAHTALFNSSQGNLCSLTLYDLCDLFWSHIFPLASPPSVWNTWSFHKLIFNLLFPECIYSHSYQQHQLLHLSKGCLCYSSRKCFASGCHKHSWGFYAVSRKGTSSVVTDLRNSKLSLTMSCIPNRKCLQVLFLSMYFITSSCIILGKNCAG